MARHVAPIGALLITLFTTTAAHAESGRFNLHFSGLGPVPAAGEVSADWQLARPFALELRAGGGVLTDFGQSSEGIFYSSIGARFRFVDDESGYLNEGGSIAGHLWVAPHVGFFVAGDAVGLMVDASLGYDFSIVDPVSIGPFVRGGVGVADTGASAFFAGGIQVSVEIDPLRRPVIDTDRDGVFDHSDACPDTPRGTVVDARGCVPLPPQLVLDGIRFAHDSDEILAESEPALTRAARALLDNPDVRVEIGGHTDDVGLAQYNLELSRRRAISVANWMLAHGIARSRLEVAGYGSSRPRVAGTDESARAHNRRIEFRQLAD